MRIHTAVLTLGLIIGSAAPLAGQSWNSPSFLSPEPGEDLGVYAVKAEGRRDLGIAGIWRQSGNINLGVRAGLTGDVIHVGGEFYDRLFVTRPDSPVMLSWVLGFGATFNDDVAWLRVPVGLSIGRTVEYRRAAVTPYVHPRITFDFQTQGSGDEEVSDTDFNVPVDLGADVELGESLVLRFGATIESRHTTFGAGAAWRMSRRLVVR